MHLATQAQNLASLHATETKERNISNERNVAKILNR